MRECQGELRGVFLPYNKQLFLESEVHEGDVKLNCSRQQQDSHYVLSIEKPTVSYSYDKQNIFPSFISIYSHTSNPHLYSFIIYENENTYIHTQILMYTWLLSGLHFVFHRIITCTHRRVVALLVFLAPVPSPQMCHAWDGVKRAAWHQNHCDPVWTSAAPVPLFNERVCWSLWNFSTCGGTEVVSQYSHTRHKNNEVLFQYSLSIHHIS